MYLYPYDAPCTHIRSSTLQKNELILYSTLLYLNETFDARSLGKSASEKLKY